MANSNISASSTHDLWVEARQFSIEMSRPSPSTIELKITRPSNLLVVDGALILLNDKPFNSTNYPTDGQQYTPSLDLALPGSLIEGAQGAHVVAFYSEILSAPMPAAEPGSTSPTITFTITISGTLPNTLYYASIHPSTNILQYYPIGIQSYPLEASRVEKDSSSYTGNIPSLPEMPTAPTPDMVYHDLQLNLVQYWTGTSWIPSRADSILTGTVHPGIPGQTYFLGGAQLMVFSGVKWVTSTPLNFTVRTATGWAPLGKVFAVISLPEVPEVGDFCWDYTSQRAQYFDGVEWILPNSTNTLFNTGTGIIPASVTPLSIEPQALPNPIIGQLFYNTTTKTLDVFTGVRWVQANTNQPGTPSTDKITIGTDGSYDERIRLIKVVQMQLGWPQTCVELKEEQFNIAIDNALDNYRMWCDGAYRMQYVMYPLIGGQQTYYLNSPTDKTDRIVGVSKIHRLNVLGIQAVAGNDAIWSSGILTSYYSAVTVDILSMHLLSSLSEEFQRLFAGDLTFLWDEPSRELFITRKVSRNEKVIIECQMERSEQEILLDRWSKQFIQNWALAECKYMIGMSRSKYTSGTPGAAGTINLNGEMLISEARQDMAELKQSAHDFEWGGLVGGGNCSFLIG